MKVSSSVTGVTYQGDTAVMAKVRFGPESRSGASKNRLEVIANGLGVTENGLEPSVQGRRYEVE
jgi:hypothetical protein